MAIFGSEIPFPAHCGFEEAGVVDGCTRIRLVTQPFHLNNLGIVHGGVICTLLDVAMGSTCRLKLGVPVMTLDMQVAFLSPGRGVLVAQGRILRAGRSLVYAEAQVLAEGEDALIAKGSGIFKPVRMEKESG